MSCKSRHQRIRSASQAVGFPRALQACPTHPHDIDVLVATELDAVALAVLGNLMNMNWGDPQSPAVPFMEAKLADGDADKARLPPFCSAVPRSY